MPLHHPSAYRYYPNRFMIVDFISEIERSQLLVEIVMIYFIFYKPAYCR